MPINEQIPLSAGPAGAAKIDQSIPMNVDSKLPLQVQPFKPIDTLAATGDAYKLADSIDQFKENQEERLDQQKTREEKQRDKLLLQQYQQNGGDLYTSGGLELAAKELGGKLSQDSLDGLTKRIDSKKSQEMKLQTGLAKMDDEALDSVVKQTEASSKIMNRAVAVYDDTLQQTKDPAKAQQAFKASKQALLQSAGDMKDPASGRPIYSPQTLQQFSQMSADQIRNVVKDTKWHSDKLKEEQVNRLRSAQTESAEATAGYKQKEGDAIAVKLQQNQQKIDAAVEKAKHTNSFDPADAEAAAELISTYRLAPLSGFAMRTPYGQKVMSLVAEKVPDYDAKDYYTRSKSEKDFATGKQGNTVRSFNVALSHLNTLDELGEALNNKDTKALNRVGNFLQKELGLDTAPTNFTAAKQLVGAEIVKAINGTGGGVTDRQEAEAAIDAASSPAALKDVIKTYKKLMQGQLSGLRTQYEAATGKTDFDKRYLTDESRNTTKKPASSGDGFPTVSKEEQTKADEGRSEILQQELDSAQGRRDDAKTPEDKHRAEEDIKAIERELSNTNKKPATKKSAAVKNSKGWILHEDAKGNRAYVGPKGEIEEVK